MAWAIEKRALASPLDSNRCKKLCAQILALLESDENSQRVVACLKTLGHSIIAPTRYTEAIIFLKKTKVNLVISDVHLENGGSVFDFLKWIRTNNVTSTTPFILYSCSPTEPAKYVEDALKTTSKLLGANLYLSMESFDSEHFGKQIQRALEDKSIPQVITILQS